jgi:Leucine-rich repeat (LRR) protein
MNDDDSVVDVEVRHGGKTRVKTRVMRDALTVEFVTRVTREGCEEATRHAPASALTFLGPGGIKFKGNDVGRIDVAAKAKKLLRLMLLVSSDEGCASKRTTTTAGGSSRGVEALRAARLAKEAKRSEASALTSKTKQRQQRIESWKATGIVGARNEGLDAMPSALFDDDDDDFRSRIRVLDCAFNVIERLPANQIASLTGLTRLVMRDNALRDADAVPWAALASLKSLSRVDLSGNALTGLFVGPSTPPPTTNESIQTLTLARNAIEVIPEGFFSGMKGLRHLSLANNRLSELPRDLRRNSALELLDASGNKTIRAIPESFAELKMLQVLDLSDNAIDASGVPPVVLRESTSLHEICLRQNPARIEALRELDGWTAFDERRKKRADKALASRVMLGDNIFDEGAAAERFERY